MTTFALIPAAGHSRRMGRPKLALPLGEKTVLEHVIGAVRDGGVERVLLVLAPHVAFLDRIGRDAGAEVLLLTAATPDMRTTVQRGLDWIDEHWHPAPADQWLLVPADHPVLDPRVIRALSQALDQAAASIAVPSFGGKRGHPTLISWTHVAALRSVPYDQGLNAYLRRFTKETVEVSWQDDSVILDVDTPDDYDKMMASLRTTQPRRALSCPPRGAR
jgi:molybdenum cofactor cytidylyltransferase